MRKNVLRKIYMACSAVAVVGFVLGYTLAEDAAPAAPAGNKLSQLLDEVGLSVSGLVSASYYHSTAGAPLVAFHQFDLEHDTFQLDQAAIPLAFLFFVC